MLILKETAQSAKNRLFIHRCILAMVLSLEKKLLYIPELKFIQIQAQSGVNTGKYPVGTRLFGYPAINYLDYLKAYSVFKDLPQYVRRIEELEKLLAATKKESE